MSNSNDMFNEPYLKAMFSDCVDAGAEFRHVRDSYVIKFLVSPSSTGESPVPVMTFSLFDDETVKVLSDVPGLEGDVPVDDFLSGLDVVTAKLLSAFDGIDRGV